MGNTVIISHGAAAPTISNISNYELGWSSTNKLLYINDGGTIRTIGHLPIASSSTLGGVKIGTGIGVASDGTISNSGVRSIGTGSANGTISVNTNGSTANVSVYGLGSAAYTASTAYAAASHNHSAANITSGTLAIARGGTGATTAAAALSALGGMPISGGTFTGAIESAGNKYYPNYGIRMNNSDIIGCNGIFFGDTCDALGEGIYFYRSSTTWDALYSNGGELYYAPNVSSYPGTRYGVYHSGSTIPIGNGGTGATTAAGARTNLGITLPSSYNTATAGKGYIRLPWGSIQIAWVSVSYTGAISTAWGSGYASSAITLGSWPAAFSRLDAYSYGVYESTGTKNGTAWVGSLAAPTTSSCGTCELERFSSQTSKTWTVSIIGIGKY